MAKADKHESLIRALAHHELRGVVRSWSPPHVGHPTWRVQLFGWDTEVLTTAQVYAMCLGLAAAERAAEPGGPLADCQEQLS